MLAEDIPAALADILAEVGAVVFMAEALRVVVDTMLLPADSEVFQVAADTTLPLVAFVAFRVVAAVIMFHHLLEAMVPPALPDLSIAYLVVDIQPIMVADMLVVLAES
jgi:hypothetical protein